MPESPKDEKPASKLTLFVVAALGCMAPNLIGMANQALHLDAVVGRPLFADIGFWIGTLTLAILVAALVALASGEVNPRRAVFLGLAGPSVFLGLAQGAPAPEVAPAPAPDAEHAAASHRQWSPFGSLLLAESRLASPPVPQEPTRVVRLRGLAAIGSQAADLAVVLPSAQPNSPTPETLRFHLGASDTTALRIPATARSVYLVVGSTRSSPVVLPAGSGDVTLEVELTGRSLGQGFARAFGFRSAAVQVELRQGRQE